jgi:hypothetical protein
LAKTICIAVWALFWGFTSAVGAAGTAPAARWLMGPGLQKQLARPIDIAWSDNPLRRALSNLSRAQEVAVLIDRRVDPDRKLTLTLEQVPLRDAFEEIAQQQELGFRLVGPAAYFGPPKAAARIRTTISLRTEEVRRLPANVSRQFLQVKPLAWSDFATPRDLLGQLAQENGLTLKGLDQVPHDLWAGADLPPLALVVRLTLIAAQFDLTFEVSPNGKTVTLVPVPEEVAVLHVYDGGRQAQAVAKQYAALAPHAQIKVVGNQVHVKGLVEDHEQITSPRRLGKRRPPPPAHDLGKTRIDKMAAQDAPVGQVLRAIAKDPKLNLDLRIDQQALQEAGISLDQPISFSVQNASLDELLTEVVKPARLKFRRHGNVVEIAPAER